MTESVSSVVDRMAALRTKARVRVRSARRLGAGARGLSTRATVGWLWGRVSRTPVARDNSAFSWVVAGSDETTVCWLHNYWSDAYGIDRPTFAASLVDADGRTRAAWEVTLEPDATVRLDVRELCGHHGIDLPFEGQLLLVLADEHVVPGRPVQLFVEYARDDGEVSGVHGQYGLMRSPMGQVVGGSRVDPSSRLRAGLVVVNAYDGPGAPTPMNAVVEVLSSDGSVRRHRLESIPARGTVRVRLDEVIPGLEDFLGGSPGQLRVHIPCPSSRVATFVEDRESGRRVVNHATIDRTFDQWPGVPAGWGGPGPTVSVLVLVDDRRDTVVSLPNVWGPRGADHLVELTLHRSDGSTLLTSRIAVRRGATVDVSLRELLRGAGHHGTVDAHAEIRLVPPDRPVEQPSVVDVVVGIRDDGVLSGEAQVGSDYFNTAVPPGLGFPDIRRTRVFTRVRDGGDATTSLFLAHPAPPTGGAVGEMARPTVTLLAESGRQLASTTLEIPPHGFVHLPVRELFPGFDEGVGPGALRVRDTGARLYGYHLVDVEGARSVTIDHLVGG